MNFNIVKGDDFYSKLDEYAELYNANELTIMEIRAELGLNARKAVKYKAKALEKGLIKPKRVIKSK